MKCAEVAHSAQCSSECMEALTSRKCISYVGPSYDDCEECFSLVAKIKKSGKIIFVYKLSVVAVQGCGKWKGLKCAGVVAKCLAKCAADIASESCISCIGNSYNGCKDCFSFATIVDQGNSVTA